MVLGKRERGVERGCEQCLGVEEEEGVLDRGERGVKRGCEQFLGG